MQGLFARFWGEEMRKALVAVSIVCSAVIVAGLLKGCASEQRPLPSTQANRRCLARTDLDCRSVLSLQANPSTHKVSSSHCSRPNSSAKSNRQTKSKHPICLLGLKDPLPVTR